ncbi:MAG: malto-oligosyltrehalose trehalohydrolase [Edaphobacter sp.]|uniref:malto-oligosyltrehalose trehalohydrolase n=1 Tax=Edaphobacter sp. TaxID=1934404 RepID=UPI00238D1A1B|nr:malto-oligosyltrehalose trehalohydrolase [Edaphobacter sp.]MDE1177788.1 malto-oligosyltrehalose trehalohydrolase [Edaphobacter sp.]
MHEFRVWAPKVERVAVKSGDETHPMSKVGERGWWRAVVESAGHGTDYGFLLDDDSKVYPDPRALWMPHGVHGASRVYDATSFDWTDQRWNAPPLSSGVIYELHIGTFTPGGTFDSAISKLKYLADLGVTHVELMPVAEFPGDFGWGYDGVALFATRHQYGGPDGLKRFVDACHANGLAVLLDVVYNHFGPVGNYTGRFGPYMTDRHRTPWGDAVNLEFEDSDQVRRFFCDNALMWMDEFHIDGLRLDAVHEYVDRSGINFMEQLATEVEHLSAALGRCLVLIAESDLNDPRIVRPREGQGYGMDAQWSDDFHHALFAVLHEDEQGKGYYADFGSMRQLAKSLTEVFVYDGIYSPYRRKIHGKPVEQLSMHRFVGCIQNHDQIGNRATGDRLEHIVGLERAKAALGLVLTAPFVPMLFQGEEFATSAPFQYFAHHEEEEMARAVSEGRKREFAAFGWAPESIPDPESQETFLRSKLPWQEVTEGVHAEMLAWCRKLIALRRHSPSLNEGMLGHVHVDYSDEGKWLVMNREDMRVVLNLGDQPLELPFSGYHLELASGTGVTVSDGLLQVPPSRLAILCADA